MADFLKYIGELLCKLGLHKWELRHPFNIYGTIYGKRGFKCERPLCNKEKTIRVYR